METFDFIIIGAGSAGCVLANRLSADPKNSVLLLEAGPEDTNPWIHVPLGFGKTLQNPKLNWMFESEPEPGLGGRRDFLARGKALGGSSSINGMIYMRGQPRDYDLWAQRGCRGWSYQDVLPYFKKAENNARGADDFHGVGGPLQVSDLTERTLISQTFIDAGREIGLHENPDFNGADQEGIGAAQVTISKGRRSSTAQAYLKPARARSNLKVVTGATARRVLFEGRRAVGMAYDVDGVEVRAAARREVVICCGAYASPQVLELSGVGDPDRLKTAGIEPLHALKGVGEGMQDHQIFRMRWRLKGRLGTLNERVHGLRAIWEGARYVFQRKGVLTNPTNPINIFVRSGPELETPDLQYQILPASYRSIRDRTLDRLPGVTLGPTLLRPESRGSSHAASPDPYAPPAILTNLLQTENDRRVTLWGMRYARRLMETAAFRPYYDHEIGPGPDAQSDADLLAYAAELGGSSWHPTSTCRMGPKDDPMAVVDPELRVRGLESLRVVDASVMPAVVSGNTNAPTIMIAEKAADMMLAG